jgi:putative salt-induced outer membrane protein YdiY
MKSVLLAVLAGLCAQAARADVVTLKNGDRVTGKLVTVKGGNLSLKSDMLGDLTIAMDKVASFSVEQPATVVVKGKTPVEGQLQLEPSGDWQVTTKGQPQTVAAASVDVIMPASRYESLVEHTAEPWQDWKGNASLGYGLQQGNQDTRIFTTTINAVRERPETPIFTPHWRTNFDLTTLLSSSSENNVFVDSRTLNTAVRPQYLFTAANFIFGLVQFDHISAQGLYLRQTYGGGYGRDLIKNSRTAFSVLGGLTYVHEKFYNGDWDDSADALIGEQLGYQFSTRVRLDHDFHFYPNLSNTGEYRFDTTTTLSAKLAGKFSLNAGVIDLYLSTPPTGNRKRGVTFTMGIGYAF